jgi:hypothetical protein
MRKFGLFLLVPLLLLVAAGCQSTHENQMPRDAGYASDAAFSGADRFSTAVAPAADYPSILADPGPF